MSTLSSYGVRVSISGAMKSMVPHLDFSMSFENSITLDRPAWHRRGWCARRAGNCRRMVEEARAVVYRREGRVRWRVGGPLTEVAYLHVELVNALADLMIAGKGSGLSHEGSGKTQGKCSGLSREGSGWKHKAKAMS